MMAAALMRALGPIRMSRGPFWAKLEHIGRQQASVRSMVTEQWLSAKVCVCNEKYL